MDEKQFRAWLGEQILSRDLALGAMPYGGINFDIEEYKDALGQWKAFQEVLRYLDEHADAPSDAAALRGELDSRKWLVGGE